MLPGVIAGHYRREEAEFDVAALAQRAFAEFVPGSLVRLDAARRVALLADGRQLPYDIASLNVGSRTEDATPGAHEHALPLKPYERLVERLRYDAHVAIAGGGASGAELAMALRHRGVVVTLYSEQSPFVPKLARRILTCGARYAIAARGSWSAQGRWAWWWKNWIDRRWMARLRGEKLKRKVSLEKR